MSGFVLVAGMLWSSYRIGYVHGRQNARKSSFAPANPTGYNPAQQPMISLASLSSDSNSPPQNSLTLTFARERRFRRWT